MRPAATIERRRTGGRPTARRFTVSRFTVSRFTGTRLTGSARRLAARRRSGRSALSGVTPFDRYPSRRLRPLAAHADRLRVPEGTVLAREGGLVHELVVVVAGEVHASRQGKGERRLGPGARFGARELLTGAPHPATLVAGPGLEVLVVNGPAYRGAAQTLPGLANGDDGTAA